jgi:exodeoxyribonuclease VII large subunit
VPVAAAARVEYEESVAERDRDRNLTLDFTAPPPPPKPAPLPEPSPEPRLAPEPKATLPAPRPAPPEPKPPEPKPEPPRTLTVAELDRAIKGSLDETFVRPVWVCGEVTGARPASSGHLYFGLKDEEEDATIDVVMYKTNVAPRTRLLVKDGARIRLRGRPTFWAPRGKLQMVCDRAEAVGKGALLEALEKLKAKLAAEGLFALERKRPLPAEPRTVGVVTSATGAVIHDICKVAFRRGGARVLLAPAVVQGDGAPESVRRALAMLQRVKDVDVILVARGGGSADELMAFNDEALVRAVASCRVPVVSAVGHEVDVTLCDFAADARAATPSQAVEMVVPDTRARRTLLAERAGRLVRAMRGELADLQQTLDDRTGRTSGAMSRTLTRARQSGHAVDVRLAALHPRAVISRERAEVVRMQSRIASLARALVARRASQGSSLAARLDAMSPLKVLGRGYAIATRADGRAVRSPADVEDGAPIAVRLAEGEIAARVVKP